MKNLTLKNFDKNLNGTHEGIFTVTAKDFVELINDVENKEENNPKSPIKIWPGQRDYRGTPGAVKEIFRQIEKVPNMYFSSVTVCYDRDKKEYYLLDGQHRYRRFLDLLSGKVTCPKQVRWGGNLVGQKTVIDADFPVDFKSKIENAEFTISIKNCSHEECVYIFKALNNNVIALTDGDNENAEKFEDAAWIECKNRARKSYESVIDDKKYIATRLLYSLNEQLDGHKTSEEIKYFESWLDAKAVPLYKKILNIEKPKIADHNFTAFANFCKMAWLNSKEYYINDNIVSILQDFFTNVDEVKIGKPATHQSVIDYTNVRALTSTNAWSERGNYIYNYVKYRNPNF